MNYVAGFLFNEPRDEVALIKKEKPEWQKGRLNGIGGKIEPGESPIEAMIREFKEETNVDVVKWREFTKLNHSGNIVHFFISHGSHVPLEKTTIEEVGWYKIDELRHLPIINNLKWLIPFGLDEDNLFAEVEDATRPWDKKS